jgi:hypothetical protein
MIEITTGKQQKPYRILLYGVEGIGKTTFAAGAPAPIFISTEGGTSHVDVARFAPPKTTWSTVLASVEQLRNDKHDFKTLIIDTINWLEPIVWDSVCAANKWQSIDAPDWGKGYFAACDQWRVLMVALEQLQAEKDMHVIQLGHCHVRAQRNPHMPDFDRIELSMHKRAAGLLKQWNEAVLFADYETLTHEQDRRVKSIESGKRLVHTNWRAAHDAKNRYNLPDTFELGEAGEGWANFEAAVKAGQPQTLAELKKDYTALLPKLGEESAALAKEHYTDNQKKLAKLVKWMRGKQ